MEYQIPYYSDIDTSPQEYASLQPPLASIPESNSPSNHPYLPQVQPHAGTHSSQSQLQPYQPHPQRTSRIHSEPIYPNQLTHHQAYIPQNTYPPHLVHQHRRTLSVGDYPYYPAGSTSTEGLPPIIANHGQNSMQSLEPLFSTTDSMLIQPPESPAGLGWPAQTATQDQYLTPPSQEQLPFGDSRWQAIPPSELEQTFYGFVGDGEVAQGLVENPLYGPSQQFETYGGSNPMGLSLQGQITHPESMAYMRPTPTYPYTNAHAGRTGIHIPHEEAQRFIQPPPAEPTDPVSTPIQQFRLPHPGIDTLAYPQSQADSRQAVEPTTARSQYGKTYVEVGVQTDSEPLQPAMRHLTSKTSGRAEATTGCREYKFVLPTATGRSNKLTSTPKRASQARKKLRPTQPALHPQTASEPRRPLPEPHTDPTTVTFSDTSLEDRHMPHTLGSSQPPVPQGGTSNHNLAGSMQVPQGPSPKASASTSTSFALRAPNIATSAPPNAPTRPVQPMQELLSPCAPSAGMHQTFNGPTATPGESIPLIHGTPPSVAWQDSKVDAPLRVPSLTSTRVNYLPTPDPSPGVSGLDQQLMFPSKSLRQEHTEAAPFQPSIAQTRQANDNDWAEGSAAHQGGVQLQGPANTPGVVPSIYIYGTEDMASNPGRASNRDYAQAGNNLDGAPQPGSQEGLKFSSTRRKSNQFSQPSAHNRGNSIDHPLAAQSQYQPTQRQPQDVQQVENHAGDKPRSISAISQRGTNKACQSQPGLVRRDEQRQIQVCSPKRERGTDETVPEQQTKRRREDKLRQSPKGAGEGAPERPAPQAARTDNEPFDVSMWSNPGLPQAIGGTESLPVAGAEDTSSRSQYQQGRIQAQGWGLGPKKPYTISESTMKHAPLRHITPPPLPTDGCSVQIAILGAPTCSMTRSDNMPSAHTIPTAIQPQARWGTEAGVESGAINLGAPSGSSVRPDNTAIWATQSQQPAPQVEGKAIGSPSALRPDCGSAMLEIRKVMKHTAVDYSGGQGQEVPIPGSTTATAVQHGITRPHDPSYVLYPQNSADLQELNGPPSGELNFREAFGYDESDTYGMLSGEGDL